MPSRGQWCGRSCVVPLGTSTARLLWAGVSSQAPAGVPLWANTAGSFPYSPNVINVSTLISPCAFTVCSQRFSQM